MNKHLIIITILSASLHSTAYAKTLVTEGDDVKKAYEAKSVKATALIQKNKMFIFQNTDGKETPKPETVTVKAGEHFYIVNAEETFVHNIYDLTDSSLLLRKQLPNTVALIVFDKPGKHSLRCAIHPTMRVDVEVK